ncbi:hypothetical protein DPEC_G00041180, partial [Dallia pectoralis]
MATLTMGRSDETNTQRDRVQRTREKCQVCTLTSDTLTRGDSQTETPFPRSHPVHLPPCHSGPSRFR